jgi:hypothetical protein
MLRQPRAEAARAPRVLRLRAHHIATFRPGDGEPGGGGSVAVALDSGATLQQARVLRVTHVPGCALTRRAHTAPRAAQLHAAIERAWGAAAAARAVPPLLHAVREAYTDACERVSRVSQLQHGAHIVFATAVDLRPTLCSGLARAMRYAVCPLRCAFFTG